MENKINNVIEYIEQRLNELQQKENKNTSMWLKLKEDKPEVAGIFFNCANENMMQSKELKRVLEVLQ